MAVTFSLNELVGLKFVADLVLDVYVFLTYGLLLVCVLGRGGNLLCVISTQRLYLKELS